MCHSELKYKIKVSVISHASTSRIIVSDRMLEPKVFWPVDWLACWVATEKLSQKTMSVTDESLLLYCQFWFGFTKSQPQSMVQFEVLFCARNVVDIPPITCIKIIVIKSFRQDYQRKDSLKCLL